MKLEILLKIAAALPGSTRDLETRTGIPHSTAARALIELKKPIPHGYGVVLDSAGSVIDWGLINHEKIVALCPKK